MTSFSMLKPEKLTARNQKKDREESNYSYDLYKKVVIRGSLHYFPYGKLNLNFRDEAVILADDGYVRMDLRECSYSRDKESICFTKLTSDNYRIVCISLDLATNIMDIEIKDFKSFRSLVHFQLKSALIQMESDNKMTYIPEVSIHSI